MAALYANENFARQTVEALRALGHDVLTTLEAGNAGQAIPDEAVLAFATRAGRAVLTLNRRDFIRLHAETAPAHAGIIVCTQDPEPPGPANPRRDLGRRRPRGSIASSESPTSMTCGNCVRHVGDALRALPGVTAVEVTLATHRVVVDHDATAAPVGALIAAIEAAGYAAAPA